MADYPYSSLQQLAFSRLYPDIFSHPVWVHFGSNHPTDYQEIAQKIIRSCSQLQHNKELRNACQLLMVCAFMQLHSGNQAGAITTMLQTLEIADRHNISRVECWANWGISALCIQLGQYTEAVKYLNDLQVELTNQGEWVLANFVELLCKYILRKTRLDENTSSTNTSAPKTAPLLREAFSWLNNWGIPPQLIERLSKMPNRVDTPPAPQPDTTQDSPLFGQKLQAAWDNVKGFIRGEKKIIWADTNGSQPHKTPAPGRIFPQRSGDVAIPGLSINPWFRFFEPGELNSKDRAPNYEAQIDIQKLMENYKRSDEPDIFSAGEHDTGAQMTVYTFGSFKFFLGDTCITNWTSRKSLLIFKYMLAHHESQVSKDILMDIFWPEADSEAARRNLHQAIYALRQSLKIDESEFQWIEYENEGYRLHPGVTLWTDHEAFDHLYQMGLDSDRKNQKRAAVKYYQSAHELYQGHYLIEDLYEDWTIPRRQYLWQSYLDIAHRLAKYHTENQEFSEAILIAQRILSWEEYQEEAHRILMECYYARGQRHLAIHQFNLCTQLLAKELDVTPSDATMTLYNKIKNG